MEPTLPVWTVRPNWKGGILERLEWLTDVLTSSTGAEQRRALRLSPRRSVEITINPTQNERTFVDLLLHKLGSNEWLFPLWFDKARLSVAAELGAERIDFDNTFREFTDGGLALIYKDAFTWEVISIGGQDSFGLDLDVPLDATWGKNVAVYPLRQARLQNETELRALSSRVGESVLLWTITEANDYPEVMPDAETFEGMPVITVAPNRSQDITINHTRLAVDRDNQVGIPHRVDPAGRAFQVQSHSWMLVGRQAQSEFRSMLYWLRGRQRAVWLPSFNEDIVTSRASALASTSLDIQKIGIAYAGGVIPGRDVVRVNGVTGRITALGAPQSPQEERLRIGAGLTAAVPADRRGSFLSPARLNQDGIEILHHADTNGAAEVSTTFKSFSNTRTTAGALLKPIPESGKFYGVCGSAFILENANFEQGLVAWQGQFAVKGATPDGGPPVDGALIGWSGNVAVGEFYQDLPIPSRFLAACDAGKLQVSGFSGYHVTYSSQTDHGQLFCGFLNGANVETSRVSTPHDYSKAWVLLTLAPAMVPPGTRKLRFGTRNIRDEGLENNSDWDAMSPGFLTIVG